MGVTALAAVLGLCSPAPAAARHKLLVVSVDGLDWRYLRDRDAMGLAIPTLRRLMARGETVQGVIGVWPTITWPSHTSIVTGVRPDQHGIPSNARRGSPFNESYWSVNMLKARTLWQCAADAGLTTAVITWPIILDAKVTYDLPEVSVRRDGGSMDLDSVAATATPGLVAAITRMYPSFPQQWVDDRTRTLAALYLLREKQPDLILLHLVDLDSEEHDQGPFETNTKAILERTDELIASLPADYDLVITSDHGFERIDRIANLHVLLDQAGVKGDLRPMSGIVATKDAAVAAYLRSLSARPDSDIGREIPRAELLQYAPALADVAAAFE
jgi:predicted AlkP superfamily pyrophosphatase or phosphodiesterase